MQNVATYSFFIEEIEQQLVTILITVRYYCLNRLLKDKCYENRNAYSMWKHSEALNFKRTSLKNKRLRSGARNHSFIVIIIYYDDKIVY